MGDELEIKKLELELAKIKYGFRQVLAVSVIAPSLLGLIQLGVAYYQRTENRKDAIEVKTAAVTQAAVVKEEVSASFSELADKVDLGVAAAVSTNAINTKWVADKSGDPADMAKAEAAEKRAEAVAEKMP